ncbi:hypothetical protein [Nostoc sphaeroides]|uniref:hypothetical protein n=1 Tax=Nostoc sphaeroides TaxID=446679 RepID=UPI00126A6997|nr:hypothetical protein [Nostoc sphaeroides]
MTPIAAVAAITCASDRVFSVPCIQFATVSNACASTTVATLARVADIADIAAFAAVAAITFTRDRVFFAPCI